MTDEGTVHIALTIAVEGDRFCLVDQFRDQVGRRSWEFASGNQEPSDPDIAATAARELREETGLAAERWQPLGVLDVAPGNMDLRCHVFLAGNLKHEAAAPDPDEGELRSEWFSRQQLETMIRDGSFCDAKSLAAYALLMLRLAG